MTRKYRPIDFVIIIFARCCWPCGR